MFDWLKNWLTRIGLMKKQYEIHRLPEILADERDNPLCAICLKTIENKTPVAIAWRGAPHPLSHLDCTDNKLHHCGTWKNGRLHDLHAAYPDTFPPSTATTGSHALRSQRPFIVKI